MQNPPIAGNAGFDPTKPVRTRDGREVTLDGERGGELSGWVEGDGPFYWSKIDGLNLSSYESLPSLDLVNVPPPAAPTTRPEDDAAFVEWFSERWVPREGLCSHSVPRLIALAHIGATAAQPAGEPAAWGRMFGGKLVQSSPIKQQCDLAAASLGGKTIPLYAAPTSDTPRAPKDGKVDEDSGVGLFDRLHIESMTREWFGGPNPSIDGYLDALKRRLARNNPPMSAPEPGTDGARIAAWQRDMAAKVRARPQPEPGSEPAPIVDRTVSLPDGASFFVTQEMWDARMKQLDEQLALTNDLIVRLNAPSDLASLSDLADWIVCRHRPELAVSDAVVAEREACADAVHKFGTMTSHKETRTVLLNVAKHLRARATPSLPQAGKSECTHEWETTPGGHECRRCGVAR